MTHGIVVKKTVQNSNRTKLMVYDVLWSQESINFRLNKNLTYRLVAKSYVEKKKKSNRTSNQNYVTHDYDNMFTSVCPCVCDSWRLRVTFHQEIH